MNPCEFDSKLWMQDNVVVFGLPMNLSQGLPLLLAVELLAVETAAGSSLLAPPNVWIARSFVTLPAQSARNEHSGTLISNRRWYGPIAGVTKTAKMSTPGRYLDGMVRFQASQRPQK